MPSLAWSVSPSFFPWSCFGLLPEREGLGQTAICSHGGMEDPRRKAHPGGQRRSGGAAPPAAAARRALRRGAGPSATPGRAGCPSAAAAPGSWPLVAPGTGGLCPEDTEPLGRGGETALFPGADDGAPPEASSFSSLGFMAPLLFRSPSPPSRLKYSRGAAALPRRCPPCPAPGGAPTKRSLPGRQQRRAVPSRGAAKVHRPIY